jgi:hypothetical protein
MKTEKVIIAVSGGVAELLSAPNGITVEIRDYDVDEHDAFSECSNLKRDGEGDVYHAMIFKKSS